MRTAIIAILLALCSCSASPPSPAESAMAARGALAALTSACAGLPASAPADLQKACNALGMVDSVAREVCPSDESEGGAGGAP